MKKQLRVAVIGLGYVGLPLALSLSKHYNTVGLDVDKKRVEQLNSCEDNTYETEKEHIEVAIADGLKFVTDYCKIADADIYIVTVPTPVNSNKTPDLSICLAVCSEIGKILQRGNIVVFESTVYPGATEIEFVPVLERVSNLKMGKDFNVGYSPERINPGDKMNNLRTITKLVSASSPRALIQLKSLYSKVSVEVYATNTIQEAEASKVLENIQRDVNIALMNEAMQIFDKLGINIDAVLDAASTKWNFVRYHPGLVGGHCIGIDPYYLIQRSNDVGFTPTLISEARRVNENFVNYHVDKILNELVKLNKIVAEIIILGASFKPNCPDFRNSKVFDLEAAFQALDKVVSIYDHYFSQEMLSEYYQCDYKLITNLSNKLLILATEHNNQDYSDVVENARSDGCLVYSVRLGRMI